MFDKLNRLTDRYRELEESISQPDIIQDREKYNAFADIVPMIIQIALLLAMISAIKQGMTKPGLNLTFLGI